MHMLHTASCQLPAARDSAWDDGGGVKPWVPDQRACAEHAQDYAVRGNHGVDVCCPALPGLSVQYSISVAGAESALARWFWGLREVSATCCELTDQVTW